VPVPLKTAGLLTMTDLTGTVVHREMDGTEAPFKGDPGVTQRYGE